MSEDSVSNVSAPHGSANEGHALRVAMAAFLFLLVLALFPFSDDPSSDIKYFVCSWASLVLFAGWMVSVWRGESTFRRPQLCLEILVLFLLLGLLASFRGSHVLNSLVEMGRFWSFFVLYFVASQVYRTPPQVRRLMLVVCIAVAVSSAYALFIQRTGIDPFPWRERTSDEYLNLPATFGNPNFAAHTLILAIIMSVLLATRLNMIWCLGFTALFFAHLHFTGQRAGVIALVAASMLFIVGAVVRRRIRRPVAAVVTTLGVVALLGVIGMGLIMGISKARHGSAYPLDLSLLIRYKSYCSAANMAMTRPLLGYGPANYKIEYPRFWTPYEQKWFSQELKMNAHAHNDLLEIADEQGLPAAGLYLAALVLAISYGLLMAFTRGDPMTRRLGFAYAAFFIAFLVDGLFGFNLRVPVSGALFFVIIGSLEGVWSASGAQDGQPPRVRLHPWIWKGAIAVLSLVCVVQESAAFASQIFFLRGCAEIEAKRFNRAEPYLRKAERLAPWNWEIARQRGVAALCLREDMKAIEHLERARELNPQYVMTLVLLARAKADLVTASASAHPEGTDAAVRALDSAAQDVEVALRLCPGFPAAEEILGRIAMSHAMMRGKSKSAKKEEIEKAWREAEEHFSTAVEHGAKNPSEIYRQLVQARMALGDSHGAEEAIIRATQADPSDEQNWPFFYSFARNAQLYDRFREAVKWRIQRLQEQKPRNSDSLSTAYLWVASVEHDVYHDDDAAETAFRNAVSCKPLSPATWSAYAGFAQSSKRLENFKKFLLDMDEQILAKGQEPLPHVQALARVWNEGPEAFAAATALLVGVVQGTVKFPGMMLPDYDMRWAIVMLGEEAKACKLREDQMALVSLHLGMAAGAISEWALADQVLAAAMPHLPPERQVDCAQHWANALIRLDRINEAVNLLRDVVSRVPEDPDLRLSLARTLIKNKNTMEAEKEYRALLELPKVSGKMRDRVRAELEGLLRKSSSASSQS